MRRHGIERMQFSYAALGLSLIELCSDLGFVLQARFSLSDLLDFLNGRRLRSLFLNVLK